MWRATEGGPECVEARRSVTLFTAALTWLKARLLSTEWTSCSARVVFEVWASRRPSESGEFGESGAVDCGGVGRIIVDKKLRSKPIMPTLFASLVSL